MWFKEIERRKKAIGLKKEKLERSDPLETSSLSLLVKATYELGGHRLMLVGNYESVSTIQYVYSLF
jgi:hypothetical protein